MVHWRNTVERNVPAANGDPAFEVTRLVEMTVVRGAPSKLAALLGFFQGLRFHRIHFRIVNIEGKHDRSILDIDDGALTVIVADVPIHVWTQTFDIQGVFEAEIGKVARLRNGHRSA